MTSHLSFPQRFERLRADLLSSFLAAAAGSRLRCCCSYLVAVAATIIPCRFGHRNNGPGG